MSTLGTSKLSVPESTSEPIPHIPTTGRTLLILLASFVIACGLHPGWSRVAGYYTQALLQASSPLVLWLQPIPLASSLSGAGTIIEVRSEALSETPVGSLETRYISFYLPFVCLALVLSTFLLRLISPIELIMALGVLFTVHVACTTLRIMVGISRFASGIGIRLHGDLEMRALLVLSDLYGFLGTQLWPGLIIALLLGRSLLKTREEGINSVLATPKGLASCCLVLLFPPAAYLMGALPLRHVLGAANPPKLEMARLLIEHGQTDQARLLAESVLASERGNTEAHMILGEIASTRAPSIAAEHYRQVLSMAKDHLGAHFFLAGLLARQGELQEALRHYYAVLEIAPEDAETHYLAASVLVGLGNHSAAREHLEKALEIQPGSPRPMAMLGRLFFLLGEPCRSKVLLDEAMGLGLNSTMTREARVFLSEASDACTAVGVRAQ